MPESQLQMTLSGEIFLKSASVRKRFADVVCRNAEAALGDGARVMEVNRGRAVVEGIPDRAAATDALRRVFGVQAIEEVVKVDFPDLERGVEAAARVAGPEVENRTFAVRCKRTGSHPFQSQDVERALGAALFDRSAGVDLTSPEVTVRLRITGDEAWLTRRRVDGPGGLPIGVQGRALVLLSGGFDSAVAAWQMMSRGVSCEFLHLELACSQRDQALAVAHRLWSRWGAGTEGTVHVLDFAEIRSQLLDHVSPRYRQVALKRWMLTAADAVADELGIDALVTGEALGQVSSQTFTHIASLDRLSRRPVLRPLLTYGKEQIIADARRIGVAELSERAGEACDLAQGHRVETGLSARSIAGAARRVSNEALEHALAAWRVHHLEDWLPGSPGELRAA